MRVVSANVNGLRSASKKGFLEWMVNSQVDVACLQEIKVQTDQLSTDLHYPKGYHAYFLPAVKKGYSGVAIYTKLKPKHVQYGLNWPLADVEGRYIQIDFEHLSIVSLYLPSGTSGDARQAIKYQFLDYFKIYLQKIEFKQRPFILCGDWNIAHKSIDLSHWKANQKTSGFLPEERAWMDEILSELGFVDAFRVLNQSSEQYTWWSQRSKTAWDKNIGWRIDYQIITPNLKSSVSAVSVYKLERFSDHAPLVIDYELINF